MILNASPASGFADVGPVDGAGLHPVDDGAPLRPNVRFAGMISAIAVSFAAVILPIDRLGIGSFSIEVGGLGVIGAPVAALAGWWLTRSVVMGSWRNAAGSGLLIGILVAYLGVLEVAFLTLLAALAGLNPSTGFGSDVTGSLIIATIGLPYGTFALPITIPCGLAWALIVRGVVRRVAGTAEVGASGFGIAHVVVLLVVIAMGAALIPVAQSR